MYPAGHISVPTRPAKDPANKVANTERTLDADFADHEKSEHVTTVDSIDKTCRVAAAL